MNHDDLRDAFTVALADPAASQVDIESAIAVGSRRQVRRRRSRYAAAVAVVVAGIATSAAVTHHRTADGPIAPSPTPTVTASALPDVVEVTCSPAGIDVSAQEIRTSPEGVRLRITSTLPRGSYLTYGSTGDGGATGGDLITLDRPRWVLNLAPGTMTLGCDPAGHMGEGRTTTVIVSDPDGNWRGSLDAADLGCVGSGMLDWAIGFVDHAASAQEAAEASAQDFKRWAADSGRPDGVLTVRPLAVGYVRAEIQTWLVLKDGQPYLTVLVRSADGSYSAGADAQCGPEWARTR